MNFDPSQIVIRQHGRALYDRGLCRCEVCRAGNTAKQRKRRAKRRQGPPVPTSVPTRRVRETMPVTQTPTFDGYTFGQIVSKCEASKGATHSFTSDTGDGSDVALLRSLLDGCSDEWWYAQSGLRIEFGINNPEQTVLPEMTFGGPGLGQLLEWCDQNRGDVGTFRTDTGNGDDVAFLQHCLSEWAAEFPHRGLWWEVGDYGLSITFGMTA